MLRRKREMMQKKKVIHSSMVCCMLWGADTLPTHTYANEPVRGAVAQAAIL